MRAGLSRVLIAAGGTGGHIFPALAVAEALRQRGVALRWVGTDRGLEARVTDAAKIPLDRLDFQGVRGRGFKNMLLMPVRLIKAMAQARRVLKADRPDLVASFGGYVTVPVGLMARLMGIPLVVHEQNAVMGSANRALGRLAAAVAVSFERTRRAPEQARWTGNPVRAELLTLGAAHPRIAGWTGPIRLLVLGGSLGARPLNQALPIAMATLAKEGLRFEVWHQTGQADEAATQQAYAADAITQTALSNGLGESDEPGAAPGEGAEARRGLGSVRVQAFIQEMSAAYRWADLVVCRAGASTVTELMALGQPAVFVPLPHAIDDHQTWNARALVDRGAALLVPQTEHLASDLVAQLRSLDRSRLLEMAGHAEANRDLQATERLVDLLQRVFQQRGSSQ